MPSEPVADPSANANNYLADAFDLCGFEELKKRGAMAFPFRHKELGNHAVAVFWDGEGVYAIDDWCPHAEGFLHDGDIHKRKVTCPAHQADFDLLTGRCVNYYTYDTLAFKAEVRDGRVWVHLPNEEPRTAPRTS